MFTARRMTKTEFKTANEMIRRDAAGALCGFAVEHHSGAKVTGLSLSQALTLAAQNNVTESICEMLNIDPCTNDLLEAA